MPSTVTQDIPLFFQGVEQTKLRLLLPRHRPPQNIHTPQTTRMILGMVLEPPSLLGMLTNSFNTRSFLPYPHPHLLHTIHPLHSMDIMISQTSKIIRRMTLLLFLLPTLDLLLLRDTVLPLSLSTAHMTVSIPYTRT